MEYKRWPPGTPAGTSGRRCRRFRVILNGAARMTQTAVPTAEVTHDSRPPRIAYFSMEIGLEPDMPTYAGGLGVLAGDTIRAAADLGIPMVEVTLIHRRRYVHQHLDASGGKVEIESRIARIRNLNGRWRRARA